MEISWWGLLAVLLLFVAYRLWLRRGVVPIETDTLRARLKAGERMVLVDVRQPWEYESGHIRGSVNMPLGRLAEESARLDPQAETILICRSGNRSLSAYHKLRRRGFTNLKNLEGGMMRWGPRS